MLQSARTVLSVSERNTEVFNRLKQELGGLTNKQAFFIAMGWGLRHGVKTELVKRTGNGVRLEYLKSEDEALLAALQLAATQDPYALTDVEQRLDLAEQYAEGGLLLLAEMFDEPGSFAQSFAASIRQQVQELSL